jgi:hypothetical protein
MPKQVNATDVDVKKLEIRGASGKHDLNPYIQELTIYENLFRPALTATMVLVDSHNLPQKLPIVGEETVDIDIAMTGYGDGKDSEKYSISPPPMHVNSITARGLLDPKQPKAQRFTLNLISETYMSSLHSKVSKSYNNDKIGDIVSDIYSTYLYDDNKIGLIVEPTERTERVIIPNLNPLDAILWLTKRAIPNENSGVNYVYYETVHGSFFVSLDSLASLDPVFTFKQIPRVQDPTGVEAVTKLEIKIKDFKFIKQFDKVKNTQRGVYASKLITHDIVTKKITQFEYGGFNEWFAVNHCGSFPPLSNSEVETLSSGVPRITYAPNEEANTYPTTDEKSLSNMIDSKVEFYPKHDQMYAQNLNDLYDNQVEKWKLRRNGHVGVYDNINILLTVNGNSAFRVGQTVTVVLPSPETTDKDKKTDSIDDKHLTGKYMITAIKHIFYKDKSMSYNMQIEVTKDGLEEVISVRKSRKEI